MGSQIIHSYYTAKLLHSTADARRDFEPRREKKRLKEHVVAVHLAPFKTDFPLATQVHWYVSGTMQAVREIPTERH